MLRDVANPLDASTIINNGQDLHAWLLRLRRDGELQADCFVGKQRSDRFSPERSLSDTASDGDGLDGVD